MPMENTKKLIRSCPICGNDVGLLLHTQHFTLPANSVLPNQYDVVSCIECGFCFADTKATQADYDQYYNQMSKYEDKETGSGGALDGIDKIRLNTAAEIISQNCINKNSSVLDIGCANGGLLVCLKEKGFTDLTGIDITQVCVNNVKQLGFKSFFGGIFNLGNIESKKYDVVILSHVLEHIRDLATAVANLKSLLNECGMLYIEVPDASRYDKHFVVPFYYFDCEHINHFDINALNNLFQDEKISNISFNEREIKVSETTPYPAISAVFKKSYESNHTTSLKKRLIVKNSIQKYIELSNQKTDYKELNKLIENQNQVLVWGAGMYTLRLMQDSPLAECNIISFLDKDSKKQGNKINEILIQSPNQILKQLPDAIIIIASALHGKEIENEIRSIDGNTKRKVLLL
jgi:SAM-dependent methyltransferase